MKPGVWERCRREGRPAAGRVDSRRAGCMGGQVADTAQRASTVTSR